MIANQQEKSSGMRVRLISQPLKRRKGATKGRMKVSSQRNRLLRGRNQESTQ